MTHLPSFLQTWQVLSQTTNKLVAQSFQDFYFAHMMYDSHFNNLTWVNDTLFGFDPVTNESSPNIEKERTAIYLDPRYGLSSDRNLSIWVAAALNNTEAQTELKSHWFSGVYQLSDTWYGNLTGWNSTISMFID